MRLDPEKDIDGYSIVERAASILAAHGLRKEAREIHQRASVSGYEDYESFRLLKEYMEV